MTADAQANRAELIDPEYALPIGLVESSVAAQLDFLARLPELLDDRVRNGRIVEAHGDLRPEHVCLEPRPVIIDCLEFNRDFRTLDAVSDLALLALECERIGALQVGDLILKTYTDVTGDRPLGLLLEFYKTFHALLRARIAFLRLRDCEAANRTTWTDKARQYLQLAGLHSSRYACC